MILRKLNKISKMFGFDPKKGFKTVRGSIPFYKDLKAYKKLQKDGDVDFPITTLYPCLQDRYEEGGCASGHYFHQDLLVARRIFENSPEMHADIGSRIDGFVAHVAAFRKIRVYDFREISNYIPNVDFKQLDLMAELKEELIDSCDSLSCLHTIEHFGLGRYGDTVDINGHLKGLDNLHKMVKPGGKLYFSTPIGKKQRIEFNAHRVFSVEYLNNYFEGKFTLDQFSYVDNKGDLHENVEMTDKDAKESYGCSYGCGIFELTKC